MTNEEKEKEHIEQVLDQAFGLSPSRKRALEEKKKKQQLDPDSIQAQVKKIFG